MAVSWFFASLHLWMRLFVFCGTFTHIWVLGAFHTRPNEDIPLARFSLVGLRRRDKTLLENLENNSPERFNSIDALRIVDELFRVTFFHLGGPRI
jgi:hypothetical protein